MMKGLVPLVKITIYSIVLGTLTSCYFFRDRKPGAESSTSGVVGESLGVRAGGVDEAALTALYGVTTSHAPAAIRPDPDLIVRNLLLQYREQGSTVAREIGRVESYRMLLGGASQDFTITPQQTYDATSLLAKMKVAEELCLGLVDPDPSQHPGWESILPEDPSQASTNILYLAQRLKGVPSSTIDADTQARLATILNTALDDTGSYANASYIPVCTALILDADSMLF